MVYQCNMTTFSLFICLLSFSFPTSVNGWICLEPSKVFAMTRSRATSNTPLHLTISDNEIPQPKSYSDPCWGTMLDDDCSMGNIYAANFVASQWIKSMPCGEGIQDCDTPSALSTPGARTDAGIENVDVMGFLGLKRASAINSPDVKKP